MDNKQSIMFAYVEEWLKTNLTKKRFSEEHQLSVYSFQYWCKIYQQTHCSSEEQPQFIEIKPKKELVDLSRKVQMELTLPSGIQIKIY